MLHEDLHGVSGGNLVHLSCNGRLEGSPRQTPNQGPIRRAPSTSLFRKMPQMISRVIQKILLRYLDTSQRVELKMGLHSARHWGDALMNWVDAVFVPKLSRVQWRKQKSTGDYK